MQIYTRIMKAERIYVLVYKDRMKAERLCRYTKLRGYDKDRVIDNEG